MTEENTDPRKLFAEAEQKVFREVTGLPDWHYKDLPKMTPEILDKLVDAIGPDHIKWITKAEYKIEGKDFKRGQVMISPEGIENLKTFLAEFE